jgi:general secretion pathway protein L
MKNALGSLSPMKDLRLRSLFDWWWGGLRACAPDWLLDGNGRNRQLVILPCATDVELYLDDGSERKRLASLASIDALPSKPRQHYGLHKRTELVLSIPRERVFRRTATLPRAAKDNLRQVLQFEMDRLTPFAGDAVFFDYRVVNRKAAGEQMEVELAVVPRELVNPPLADLRARGILPSVVNAPGLWEGANFLEKRAGRGARLPQLGAWVTTGLIVVLLLATYATPLWQAHQVVSDLEDALQAARNEARTLTRLQQQLTEETRIAGFVKNRQNESIPVLILLRVLTDTLPDGTWLSTLSIQGNKVELMGESNQATQLIELLEDTDEFDAVAFRAPLTKARGSNNERFSIIMDLVDRPRQ